jgi:hypothetical protein
VIAKRMNVPCPVTRRYVPPSRCGNELAMTRLVSAPERRLIAPATAAIARRLPGTGDVGERLKPTLC